MLDQRGSIESQIPDDTQGESTRSAERFLREGDRVTRVVALRNGGETVSSVVAPECRSTNLGDAYDAAWLAARDIPPASPSGTATNKLRVADLFSGCGGLSVGLREACRALQIPVEFALASDLNEAALDVYKANFHPMTWIGGPIEEVLNGKVGARRTKSEIALANSVGRVDFVVAGPPCQGHSDLNNHTRREDPKNTLVLRVARFVELFRPTHVLIENVQGIRHDRLGSLGKAMDVLSRLGYEMDDRVLSADRLGAAQARKRFFLVASLAQVQSLAHLDAVAHKPRSLEWAIGDLLDISSDTAFDSSAKHSAVNSKRIDYLFDNNLYELPNSERPACHRDKDHSYVGVYGRMRWDRPAPTITTGFGSTGQGRFVHPLRRRTLTPHEAARVQFFPDFFDFGLRGRRQYQELIGNAVPAKLAYAICLHQLR